MSIPTEKRHLDLQRFSWVVRAAPIAVALILATLWLSEAPPRPIGFSFSAPSVVAPGTRIALRAWQLTDDGIDAPSTSVDLFDRKGTLISTTIMTPSRVAGLEAEIMLPKDVQGVVQLVAHTRIDGEAVSASYSVSVETEEAFRAYRPVRETSPFQVYELGPLQRLDPVRAPEALDPRVEEGACVPELPCWLSVWVGDEPTRVRLRPITGVRLDETEAGPAAGFLRFPVVVAANEARIEVQALDPTGRPVATRQIRLPIVPGGIVARGRVSGAQVRISWEELGGATAVLVDAYLGNRWTYAMSVTPDRPVLPVSLEPGVWRLQVRRDLFSTNTAGVTHVAVTGGGRNDPLRMAARAVLDDAARDGLDPIAVAAENGEISPAQAEDAILALFGPRNFGVVA
ncbi:MAG: hypothetical protein WBG86_08475, partial [Polyangiales bacterium]